MLRAAACVTANPAELNGGQDVFCGRRLKIGQWPHHLCDGKRSPMNDVLIYALVPIAVGAVAVVLLLGLSNLARGGSPQRSQKLMQLRVLLQFVAIIVIMLTIWIVKG
jgi:hypothetical protein